MFVFTHFLCGQTELDLWGAAAAGRDADEIRSASFFSRLLCTVLLSAAQPRKPLERVLHVLDRRHVAQERWSRGGPEVGEARGLEGACKRIASVLQAPCKPIASGCVFIASAFWTPQTAWKGDTFWCWKLRPTTPIIILKGGKGHGEWRGRAHDG